MRKLNLLALFLTAFCFFSCRIFKIELVCYDAKEQPANISFLTTNEFDSVHVFLDDIPICLLKKKFLQKLIICKDTTVKDYFYAQPNSDVVPDSCELRNHVWYCWTSTKNLIISSINENIPDNCSPIDDKWYVFTCYTKEFYDINNNAKNNQLKFNVFSNNNKAEFYFSNVDLEANIIHVLSEQDTTKWFKYEGNTILPFFEAYQNPSIMNRKECINGYCIATFPAEKEEICNETD